MAVNIIINADDLGGSHSINDETNALIEKGKISSATMMGNGPAVDEAIRIAKKYSDISFGVHLNITAFVPLTEGGAITRLLDANKCLSEKPRSIYQDSELKAAIFSEWSQQIERFLDNGILLSHIDSHQHVHTIPSLFFTLKKIQKKFHIHKVRTSKNIYSNKEPISSGALIMLKKVWKLALKRFYSTKTTDGFTSLTSFVEAIPSSYARMQSIEIMVHPGSNNEKMNKEIELLQSDWQSSIAQPLNLTSYVDL